MLNVLIFLLLLVCINNATSFSSELLKRHCNKEIKEGEIMMGQGVGLTLEHIIKVFRNDIEVRNGSIYYPNERLVVTIVPEVRQFVLEVNSNSTSYFENGKCEKQNRSNTKNDVLVINSDHDYPITITGVIAKTYSSGVKLMKSFILLQDNSYEEL
jgi:hypothetical protein